MPWTRRSSAIALGAVTAAILYIAHVTGQTPPRADAAISGVVIDGATKQPIADAVVQLGSVAQRDYPDVQRRQFSDTKGRFAFTDLPASNDYTVTVVKSGYFDGAYGRAAGGLQTTGAIAVADGQWFKDATVTMWRPGSLSGMVIDERGQPVVGVFVRAISFVRIAGHDRYAVGPLVTTDDRGIYRIGLLRPGRYVVMVPSVQASAPASASATTLQGLSAQAVANLQAGGRPVPTGDPMVDVDATTRVGVGGFPIPPPPVNGHAFTYPLAFSGGSSLAQAAAVVVDAGADRTGVDVRLDPVPALRISGVVQGPPDAIAGLSLRLLAEGAEDLGMGAEAGTSLVGPDGAFVFANVPAGTYTIEASIAMNQYVFGGSALSMFYAPQAPRPPGVTGISTMSGGTAAGAPDGVGFSTTTLTGKKYWGRAAVTASGGDVTNVVVPLQASGSISGRLVGEADPGQPEPTTPPSFVHLETATGSVWEGSPRSVYNRTAAPGEFIIDGVLPGLYLFRDDSAPWMIKSVILNGRDYTYRPIDTTASQDFSGVVVTFTNAIPSLTGTAHEGNGAPATGAAVVIFPVEPDQWTNFGLSTSRIKSVRASSAGAFRIRSIPAGDYFVIAVPEAQINAWQEPDFFRHAQSLATRVSIGWGKKKTVDVQVTEIR